MHFLTYVFIPSTGDVSEAVAKALKPFGDEFEVKPWKYYLNATEVAAMAKSIGVRRTALRALADRLPEWMGCVGNVDKRGLFAIETRNRDAKWDWYEIGGRWNDFIPDNVMAATALRKEKRLKKLLPHYFLTPDGQWHSVATFPTVDGRLTVRRRSSQKWLSELKVALATFADHRVVVVDLHT